ncbi:hypothetical protein [Cohnella thailandensis]|uniref:Uncharacterized protein n=1 Tax=Cohnella thailandensis TaxID=557557 RepID=A0A841SSZ0_9BACL|nr:hypothetical protein [Cohnella thailandensis]MBB6633165.1 hypothetical protein [Cohnella thailandensis]MBP1975139.1 hypothetical protein [Cohnella thailandensis]
MNPAVSFPANAYSYTIATFRALAEAIVPFTPSMAEYGAEQTAGAVQLHVHEYIIWELDHSLTLAVGFYPEVVPLAYSTAALLNSGASQMVASVNAQFAPSNGTVPHVPFAALSPADRVRTLSRLERLEVDLRALPPPFRNDGGLVKFIVDYLNRAVMFGNYSEWPAYGTTRLETPTRRRLEGFPVGWKQAGYPGVSLGYRALRGYPLTIIREDGGYTIV